MKSQTMADSRAMEYMKGRKIMEINPDNNIVAHLKQQVDKGQTGEETKQMIRLLYETSLLTSGFSVDSPAAFASRVFAMVRAPRAGRCCPLARLDDLPRRMPSRAALAAVSEKLAGSFALTQMGSTVPGAAAGGSKGSNTTSTGATKVEGEVVDGTW